MTTFTIVLISLAVGYVVAKSSLDTVLFDLLIKAVSKTPTPPTTPTT